MPEYDVMVVCTLYATYTIEAETQAEAIEEARGTWSEHDLYPDTAELQDVLVRDTAGVYTYPA